MYSSALGQPGWKNMATDGYIQRQCVRAQWERDALDGPVCGSARLEISLSVLPARPGEQGMNQFHLNQQWRLCFEWSEWEHDRAELQLDAFRPRPQCLPLPLAPQRFCTERPAESVPQGW